MKIIFSVSAVLAITILGLAVYRYKTVSPMNNSRNITGILVKNERPSPEIAYDYRINLDKPEMENVSGGGTAPTNFFIVMAANESVKAILDTKINKKVTLIGTIEMGLAESTYFLAEKVK